MKVLFLHLSDFHFRQGTDPALARVKQIAAALGAIDAIADACVVAATGDIAFSGRKAEFEVAERFFYSLRDELAQRYEKHNVKFFVVPGNHDCDLSYGTEERASAVGKLLSRLSHIRADDSVFPVLFAAQSEFFRFASKTMDTKAAEPWTFYEQSLTFDGVQVHIRCYNTSFASQLPEQQGKLGFPVHLATAGADLSNPDSITIALLHHPHQWFESNNGIALRKHLDTVADLVLTGHQHIESTYRKKSIVGDEVEYIEGAALQDENNVESAFNMVLADLKEQRIRRFQFRWKDGAYALEESDDWAPFPRKACRGRFELSSEHQQFLTDPGTGFTHPRTAKLTLEDIFVYPDLSKLSLGKSVAGRDIPEIVRSKDTREFLLHNDKLFISGSNQAGKTSLAKVLFMELVKSGYVPIFISGAELKNVKEPAVIKLVNQAFARQYSDKSVNAYKQLQLNKKVLILDSWHQINLNPQGRAIIAELFAKLFSRVYIFSGESFRIEEIRRHTEIPNPLRTFQFCEIGEFGHVLRAKLIEKWHGLERDYTWDVNEHAHEIHETEKLLATLLGKNFIPSYPVNTLSILQALEARRSTSTPSGSYGYLYEALLTVALAKVANDSTELDLMYTFISRLAFFVFSTERKLITRTDMERISEEYHKDYSVKVNVSDYIDRLESAQVLLEVNGNFSFRYTYVYYYFVARYLQEALRDSTTASEIRKTLYLMADQVYFEDYQGILLFFLYLTKDTELIRHIIGNADSIYRNQELCDFDQDVDFINRLYTEPPKVLIPSSDLERNREEYRKRLDEDREADRFLQVQNEKVAYSEELSETIKLNIAFKTLQLLGQVLRNFPGSLHKDIKLDIARSCYFLGLRVTRAILKIAENNLQDFRNYVAEIIRDHRPSLTDGELAKTADEAVIWLARRMAFGMVKRVSFAVGLERLQETYKTVLETSGEHLAIRLIDLSVQLDHFSGFPEGDIDQLWADVRKNNFCRTLIRDMVAQYIYLFGLDYRILPRIGKKLDIKVSDPRLLDPRMKKLKK
jgi:Calcineurin-like phosphoesterase